MNTIGPLMEEPYSSQISSLFDPVNDRKYLLLFIIYSIIYYHIRSNQYVINA